MNSQAGQILAQEEKGRMQPLAVLIIWALHIPLGLFMFRSSEIATFHALAVLGIGLIVCLLGKRVENVFYVSAYIVGSEVLWRATHAHVFWEFGKYATILILCIAILRFRQLPPFDKRPLIYFLLLLPSLLLLPAFDREAISFNLSGPLSLAVATMFFSKVNLAKKHVLGIFVFLLAPVVALSFLALDNILTAKSIVFMNASMKITSADFGPNQVSSILGLGSLAAFYYALLENRSKIIKVLMLVVSLSLLVQSVLTFSRGGLWTTIIAIAAGSFFTAQDRRTRVLLFFSISAALLVSYFIIVPVLNTYSEGYLLERYSDPSLTGRDLIIKADWFAFLRNPLAGVGPGQSNTYHALFFRYSESHTEYTRLLAEHGSFGLLALLILVWIAGGRIIARKPSLNKALILSCTVWAMLYMFHAGMRLVAPAIMFGVASATFRLNEE